MRKTIAVLMATTLFFSACAEPRQGSAASSAQEQEAAGLSSESSAPEAEQNAGDFKPAPASEVGDLQNDYIRGVTDEFIARLALDGKSDAEKILAAYRELVASTWFDDPIGLDVWRFRGEQSEPPPFIENRALSPLLFGIGSCEDYAAAMTVVLRRMGFEARYIPGLTISVERKYMDHAWAVVQLDGEWYHLDPQLEGNVMDRDMIGYRYFLKPDEWMRADHLWGENWISYGMAGELPLTPEQIAEIRRDFTPPVCDTDFPAPPREKLNRLPPPDKAALTAELERERLEAGQPPASDTALNIVPPVFCENATPASGVPPERELPYGTGFLSGAELMVYRELERAAAGLRVDLLIEMTAQASADEWKRAVCAFMDDNPRYYWAKPEPHTLSDGAVTGFVLSVRSPMDVQEVERRQRELETTALEILENVPLSDRFTQATAIHDEVVKRIWYDSEGDGQDSANAYGGLVLGGGICDAFARSYQYLLQLRGIPCIYISGRTPWGAYHSWNAVKLEGGWYYVDATWDRDARNGWLFHDYLFLSYEEMAAEHITEAERFPPPPQDNLTAENYYIKKGYFAAAPRDSAKALAAAFLKALEDTPLEKDPKPVFLEIRVEDDAQGVKITREYFAKNTFEVLEAINNLARERGSGTRVVAEGKAEFNFNDSTRVLTLIPKAYQEETGSTTKYEGG